MRLVWVLIPLVLIGIIVISESFAEEEIMIFVENDVRKIYYTGENIMSTFYDHESSSVIFETGKNAKLEIKAPKVYKKGPGLFILKNGEEVAPETRTDDCFYYVDIETKVPEKIEILFAFWPEYQETKEGCETFTVSPLKQYQLGVSVNEIRCKEFLVLMEKHDGSPACVMKKNFDKFIQRNWGQPISHNNLVMTDVPSDVYLPGMPISFKVTETGWGNPCNSMLLSITNLDTDEIVWNRSERHPCPSTPQDNFFTHVSYVPDSRISELSFEETGNYQLKIESRNEILEHYFSVKLGEKENEN